MRISSFHATLLAWKSIEWPSVPSLTSVTVNRSPTLPRSTGPGTLSLNVHSCCVTPGATSITFSVACMVRVCSTPPSAGASVGSYGCQPSAGAALKSIVAPVAAPSVDAPPAAAAGAAPPLPATLIVITIPAAL